MMTRRFMRWLGYGLAVLVLAALGLIAVDRLQQPPEPDHQALLAQAAQYQARIQRDEFGVPHISGPRDVDVAYGLAFAHAEDDFATIQDVLRATRGTLAAIKGKSAAPTDYLVQLFGVWDAIKAHYETDLPADVRAVMQAYADGLNHYAVLHPDQVERGTLPMTGRDIAAGFVFKSPFFFGMEDQLKRLTAAPKSDAPPRPPKGSNGIAIAPSRSADGATRLLVNSHQPYIGAVAWYEAVLQSGEGWHVAGGFFPGSPFMLHGHNEHLGWAHTVNKPASLITIYKLALKPDDPDQYLLDGQWRKFETTEAALRIKLLGPLAWTFHRPLLHSAHGPVLKTDSGDAYALRWAGMGEVNQALQYFRENKARDVNEWKAAVAINAVPSLNYIYADEKGHIGFLYNGKYPDLPPNLDVSEDLPGDQSALIWKTYRPANRVPQIWDPKSGYVFNSNNTPFHATGAQDQLKAEDFPRSMGLETHMNNRALRVEETYGADTAITAEAFRQYKYDLRYSEQSTVVALVGDLLALNSADLAPAQDILRRWNRSADRANREAPLVLLTAYKVLAYQGPRLMAPEDGLRQAMAALQKTFGRLDPAWGEVNRIRRGTVDLPIDGARDTYRSVWGDVDRDGRLKAQAGDTLIMFVEWDKDGRLSSRSIHQFGSATLDATSPHYADQTPLFAAMQTKPVLFTQEQLKGHVREDYAPGKR